MASTTSRKVLREELPPFSFSKQPIKSNPVTSAIPAEIHKIAPTPSELNPEHLPTFNDINYDDQIRAPRMSLATHYTYRPELPRSFVDKRNTSNLDGIEGGLIRDIITEAFDSMTEDHLRNLLRAEPGIKEPDSEMSKGAYQPAIVDINQPTRRDLEPCNKKWGSRLSVGNILSLEALGNPDLLTSDKMVKQEHLDLSPSPSSLLTQQKLLRAVENLDSNKTLQERQNLDSNTTLQKRQNLSEPATVTVSGTPPKTHGARIRHHVSEGPAIQQVYTPKKPACLPAVLRPLQEVNAINEEDLLHDLSAEESGSPKARLNEFPFRVPKEAGGQIPTRAEPTHEHWKPNHSSDHCMNCFEVFRSFLNPQKRGRHHCRFCGLLYCQNCLYKSREALLFDIVAPGSAESKSSKRTNSASSNASSVVSNLSGTSSMAIDEACEGVMLDSKARMVIPLFKNLAPVLAPVLVLHLPLVQQGTSLASLQEKFKTCKVCKTCGHNSRQLLYLLNQRSRNKKDIDSPYVFIENPYVTEKNNLTLQPHHVYELKSLGVGNSVGVGVGVGMGVDPNRASGERRLSYNNVPSDWTWSSF